MIVLSVRCFERAFYSLMSHFACDLSKESYFDDMLLSSRVLERFAYVSTLQNDQRAVKRLCFNSIKYRADEHEEITAGQNVLVLAENGNFVGRVIAFFRCPLTGKG